MTRFLSMGQTIPTWLPEYPQESQNPWIISAERGTRICAARQSCSAASARALRHERGSRAWAGHGATVYRNCKIYLPYRRDMQLYAEIGRTDADESESRRPLHLCRHIIIMVDRVTRLPRVAMHVDMEHEAMECFWAAWSRCCRVLTCDPGSWIPGLAGSSLCTEKSAHGTGVRDNQHTSDRQRAVTVSHEITCTCTCAHAR